MTATAWMPMPRGGDGPPDTQGPPDAQDPPGAPGAPDTPVGAGDAEPVGPVLAEPLTDVLFDGRFDAAHRHWAEVLRRKVFRYRDGSSLPDRSELAYERLRVVNDTIGSVEEFVGSTTRLVALHEWLGMVDGSVTTLATIHYNLFLGSLLRLDPGRALDPAPFVRLHDYGAVLITELGYGNNAADLETTATYRPETDDLVLHTPTAGAQKFMPNTGPSGGRKSGLVAARLIVRGQNCGIHLFFVPLRDDRGPLPGIRIRRLSEIPGSAVDHAITSFDRVVLPRSALLAGEDAELTAEGAFHSAVGSRRRRFLRSIQRVTTGKLCLSGAAVGGARSALAIAVRYAHHRQTFAPAGRAGVSVFAYRCHQTRLLGAVARAYAATFLLREAVRDCGRRDDGEFAETWAGAGSTGTGSTADTVPGEPTGIDEPDGGPGGSRGSGGPGDSVDSAEVDVLVAAAKGWITWQSRDIAMECRERCGAQGLLSANRIVDLITPIESTITAEGDNLVIWTKAAADMLTGRGYRPPAGAAVPPGPPTGTLTDSRLLLGVLSRHEAQCLRRARDRLGRPSTGPMDRWNHAVNPALDLVDAYATRRAAEAYLAAVDRIGDAATRGTLDRLFQLFALQRLAPHAGELLADGHLTAEAVRGIGPAVDRITAELAPHALTLVDAFAIPDEVLEAPIATEGFGAVYDDPAGPWHQEVVVG
ncbi:acyl-CoA dehydrogenase [Actinacidiphila reveromycinica]|uniref:acyl-CoA dehydrogenase family protein n=1 Tax=Actinacidiphila reveromycinica TaxID=659352 RepID=UPI001F327D8C|nr:acyl-CoA dehydrogenase [Streptomyces sp. SN-593]